jgi:hypothetical protein
MTAIAISPFFGDDGNVALISSATPPLAKCGAVVHLLPVCLRQL